MAGLTAGNDPWKITVEERAKHDNQFFQLKPINGYITGEQARGFFLQSGLPTPVLGQIWGLADLTADGKMDRKEFSIAMHLIKNKLQGMEVPRALPASMKADPTPSSPMKMMFSSTPNMSAGGAMVRRPVASMGQSMPPMGGTLSAPGSFVNLRGPMPMANGGFSTVPRLPGPSGMPQTAVSSSASFAPTSSAAQASDDWAISQLSKLKYTQMFNTNDRQRKGFLTGLEARNILMQTGLNQQILAQVWSLSDVDNDGKLSTEEFVLAMHLIDVARTGNPLPGKLPPELIPPRYRRGPPAGHAVGLPPTSVATPASSGIGGLGMSPPPSATPQPQANGTEKEAASLFESPVTFEDKRKENFDKGQAELERRRELLRQQQEKENSERLAKERAEYELREKKRLEQEMKRQQELERQMERQRAIEHQREEERKKIMEQRESARRELERQRQLEWERQRRDQLMAEKQREQAQVDQLHVDVGKLKLELETLDSKKTEIKTKIDQAHNGVTDFTQQIEKMRVSRDLKLADVEKFTAEIQEWNRKLAQAQQERQKLDIQVQAQTSQIDDTYKTVMHSYNTKKANVEKLRSQLADLETQTTSKLSTIDANNAQLNELHNSLQALQSDQHKNDVKPDNNAWGFGGGSGNEPSVKSQDIWSQAFNSSSATTHTTNNAWGTSTEKDDKPKDPKSALDDMWAKFDVTKDMFSNSSQSNKGSTWSDSFFSASNGAGKDLPSGCPGPDHTKYKAVFQFDARNPDELTLQVGDVVWIKPDQSAAEPGWLGGVKGQSEGWFPEAYVERCPDEEQPSGISTPGSTTNGWGTRTPMNTPIDPSMIHQQQATFESDFGAAMTSMADTNTSDAQNTGAFTAVQSSPTQETATPTPYGQEVLKAQALYPWKAKKDNHLTFNKGDTIVIKEQQDMWWSGELNGQVGWFPKSYVKLIGGAKSSSIPVASPQDAIYDQVPDEPAYDLPPEEDNAPVYETNEEISPEQVYETNEQVYETNEQVYETNETPADSSATHAQPAQGEQYLALYTFPSVEEGDLSFHHGDIITVTQNTGEWWTGQTADGRIGIFPANYVQKVEPQVSQSKPKPTARVTQRQTSKTTTTKMSRPKSAPLDSVDTTTKPATPETPEIVTTTTHANDSQNSLPPLDVAASPVSPTGGANSATPSPDVNQIGAKLVAKKAEIATVIAAYQATGPEQLSLNPGQLIQVRKKSNSGWWEGELQARGQKRKIGWFPANYVKLTSASARSTPVESGTLSRNSLSTSPQPDGSRSATPVSFPAPTVAPSMEQVVALYNYSALNDDELTFAKGSVINVLAKEDNDWWKGELNGVTGMFPSNYVSPLSQMDGQAAPSLMSPDGDQEKKRLQAIQELIYTEEQYMGDLTTYIDVYYKPIKAEGVLTEEDFESIFVNLKELKKCNMKLNKALKVRKRMCGGWNIQVIGDILYSNLPHLTPYVRFCSCQLNATQFVQMKIEEDNKFKEVHSKCLNNPKARGMPLNTFVLKPMQRITKYPMLIEKILKYTPVDHADYPNLEEALKVAGELCNQVNEGVREKENSDRLEWIQAHVVSDSLKEKLIFNSVTNCLGPRKYLYSGTLYKAKSGKELVGFLFNDFLLLTQPQRAIGQIASVFSFDVKANVKFKIYRNPIFLNDILLKKPSESDPDPCVLQFHHTDGTQYMLKAISQPERDAWLKQMEKAWMIYLETEKKKKEKARKAKIVRAGGRGRLLVIVVAGIKLIAADDNGKSDPYCEVSLGHQENKTKVIDNCLNPKWNESMQFMVKDPREDVLCITVYDRDYFTPNDFLGRTEIRIKDVYDETKHKKEPITKRLKLFEVDHGEVVVKLDLQLFEDQT